MARKDKDKTEVGITGKLIPKPNTPKQQHELEKKRRLGKHLGKNVGGHQYSSDVNPYTNPRSVREEVLSYLLDEGFASDEKSAEAIMGAMSEAWVESIVEKTIVSVEGDGKRKYTQSKGDMKADAQSAKEKSDAVEHGRKRKTEMDAGRLTVATKRGIEKATNRSERTTGYAPNSNSQPHERDDSFSNRNARRRRESGR
jgi:hypothetical protein